MPGSLSGFALLGSLINAAMLIHVLAAIILLVATWPFMRKAVKRTTPFTRPKPAPPVVMTIPVGGVSAATKSSLQSLLEQDYGNYQVTLVTASKEEPAAKLINHLCEEYPHASHVVAGKSNLCCQKNHNLLAGLTSTPCDNTILVFCDSTHMANKDFLARLISPISENKTKISSGYRFVQAGDNNLGTLCQLLSVQSIHMLQAIKPITQPWGGATAICSATFFDNNIPDLWKRTIVDDFTMGPYLQTKGIRSLPVPEACLVTRLSGQSLKDWDSWFFRQLQYLKFGMPFTWLCATIIPLIFLCILVYLLLSFAGILPTTSLAASLLYLLALAAIGAVHTQVIPNGAPAHRRIAAYFILHLNSAIGYLRTWTTNVVLWQDIAYRTKLGGEVVEITRSRKTLAR